MILRSNGNENEDISKQMAKAESGDESADADSGPTNAGKKKAAQESSLFRSAHFPLSICPPNCFRDSHIPLSLFFL
jgi:hypothetical protein